MHSALGKLLNTTMVLKPDNFPKGKIETTCLNNSSEKQYSQKYNHINSNVKKAICLKEFLEQDFILFVFIQPRYSVTENTHTIFWILPSICIRYTCSNKDRWWYWSKENKVSSNIGNASSSNFISPTQQRDNIKPYHSSHFQNNICSSAISMAITILLHFCLY